MLSSVKFSEPKLGYDEVGKIIAESGIPNILLLGAGLSPRGWELTANPDFHCLEWDVAAVVPSKQQLIKYALLAQQPSVRENLHVMSLDPKNQAQFGILTAYLTTIREQGLCVVSENLINDGHPFSPNEQTFTIRLGDTIRRCESPKTLWIIAESDRGWSKLSSTYFTSHSFARLENVPFPGGEVRVYQPYAVSPALATSAR